MEDRITTNFIKFGCKGSKLKRMRSIDESQDTVELYLNEKDKLVAILNGLFSV